MLRALHPTCRRHLPRDALFAASKPIRLGHVPCTRRRPFIFWASYSSPSLSQSPEPSWRSRIPSPSTILLGFIPVFTLGLGFWQVYRLKWKVALIDELEDKLGRAALWLPKRINVAKLPDFAFRRVLLQGTYNSDQTIYVGPRTREGALGYHVVTPLSRPDGGSTVLVDRGFIAREYGPGGARFAQSPLRQEQGQEVTVEGLLRMGKRRGWFTPDNKPEKGEWYWVDVPGMAKWFGGEENNVQEVFVEEIFEGHSGDVGQRISQGIPVGRTAKIELRNMHAVYAATWFSLSAATAAMFWAMLSKGRGRGKGKKWRP